ncbi:hypothetical protein [Streptacidiphilus carbonis]|uniref:hypothetical protein n=1 Tax=Streptacidiphilus carbonis TaxID=105422 RepID=UPI001269EE9A|nr:hypothetical protein [Streptacidiphilus carbonis]
MSLPDGEWFAASQYVYSETWRGYAGSPETFADAGRDHLGNQNFAVAMLFFGKSIDLLHTLYTDGGGGTRTRQPSAVDLAITSGFTESLAVALETHPTAPVAEPVREATHRLRTISSACRRAGVSADLYLNALGDIATASPSVNVDDILW